MKNIGLWYSSLSDKVFLGKSKDLWNWHRQFTGDKIDYTNNFLGIVEQYFKKGSSRVIKKGKEETLYIAIDNTKEAKERLIKSLQEEINTPKKWEVWSKFKRKNWEIHIIKDIMEDGEGKYIIAEDGVDYGYIWETDKELV